MLVELRRQLDEITRHVGAGEARVGHVRQKAVQAVTKLVKQGFGFVERQQRRFALRGLREIAGVDDERDYIAVEPLLIAERAHPGAAALRGAREVIAVEQADLLAVPHHLPDAHIRMIKWNVVPFRE